MRLYYLEDRLVILHSPLAGGLETVLPSSDSITKKGPSSLVVGLQPARSW